jgi:peroxiredoxin
MVAASLIVTVSMAAESVTTGLKIGSAVEDFTLPDAAKNEPLSLTSLVANAKQPIKAVAVMFIATQCPVSNDYNARMEALNKAYGPKGVAFVGINSNKQESVKEIVEHSKAAKFSFPVLKDMDNKIADEWNARVTPEVFVLAVEKKGDKASFVLKYHGAIDDSQNVAKIQTKYVEQALDALLAGKPVPKAETKAFGCTIKRVDKGTKEKPSATP